MGTFKTAKSKLKCNVCSRKINQGERYFTWETEKFVVTNSKSMTCTQIVENYHLECTIYLPLVEEECQLVDKEIRRLKNGN